MAKARAQARKAKVARTLEKKQDLVRRSYGFRSYDVTTTALYHGMGNLPEPDFPHRFC